MLKYIGNGSFIPDLNGEPVPARDLTDAEVAHFGEMVLLASGLYTRELTSGATTGSSAGTIDLRDGVNEQEATLAGKALAARRYSKGG
jgi:hypothetical protein